MTRVVVVADSGSVMSDLTAAIGSMPGAYIARHGSGRAPLDRLVASIEPDLVVIGDLERPAEALTRLAEVRRAAPAAKVVMLSSKPDRNWLADALRTEASAVLTGAVEREALAIVLLEAIAAREPRPPAHPEPDMACERLARPARGRRRRRTRRDARLAIQHDEMVA